MSYKRHMLAKKFILQKMFFCLF